MEVKQIYTLMNSVSDEVLGKTNLITEDLTGIVDMGTEIFNANAVDNYVKSLVNHIGKVVFVNRPYSGKVPSVLMDSWEFGSVLEKVSADIPQATANESWELADGGEYKQDVFYKPKVSAKFFNSKVTFEVPVSITELQVKESFSSAAQLNGFLSMIYNAVDKSMTIKTDALIMRTINNMVGETLKADSDTFGTGATADYSKGSTTRCINLLKLYNNTTGSKLTADKAITTPDFIRFASYQMGLVSERMQSISTLFNVGGKERFTSKDNMHAVLLSDFAQAAHTYLYADTYHNGEVMLPQAESVPCWQASGTDYSFANVSKIDIKNGTEDSDVVSISGVLGVLFDRDALGVCNTNKRVTTNYNAKAEFYNNYYKFDCGYFNDTNENFVVFFVA
jgi:hypothetical protein